MARKKASGSRRKLKPGKLKPAQLKSTHSASSSVSVETLLQEAEQFINTFDYELAKECCTKVMMRDPRNTKAMEILASISVDEGDLRQAESLYLQCIQISPDDGYEKYFSLGQIYEGKESLEFYSKGISVIKRELQRLESSPSQGSCSQLLKRAMSDAYCSIADLYTTDLCDEDDAEELCKKAMESACEADADNPEAYQCLANFHLIKSEEQEAREMMKKSLSLWLPQHEALLEKGDVDRDSEVFVPEYGSRVKASQLLIELEMHEEASKVLDGLLDENDQDCFLWFLLGWSNYLRGDIYKGNARFYLEKAKEVASKHSPENEDLLCQIGELLLELKDYEDTCSGSSDKENGEELGTSDEDDNDNHGHTNEEMDMEL